jgi:hypothetical protein
MLGEVLLGEPADALVMLQPGVPASELESLRHCLPYLRRFAIGGVVPPSTPPPPLPRPPPPSNPISLTILATKRNRGL